MKSPVPIAEKVRHSETYQASTALTERRMVSLSGVNSQPGSGILGLSSGILPYINSTMVGYPSAVGDRVTAVNFYEVPTGAAVTGVKEGMIGIETVGTETFSPGDLLMTDTQGRAIAWDNDPDHYTVGIAQSGPVKGYGYTPDEGLVGLYPFDGNPAKDAEATYYVLVELTLFK